MPVAPKPRSGIEGLETEGFVLAASITLPRRCPCGRRVPLTR
jgi:hypothetical protein